MRKVPLLADEYTVLYESPNPATVYAYTPGICRLPSGRLVATLDLGGPGVKHLPGPKAMRGEGRHMWQGKVYTSDDAGVTWVHRTDFPFFHARPFVAGEAVYVLGHSGDLCIIGSNDGGETWSSPVAWTEGEWWHQSACSVVHLQGRVHLVMERLVGPPNRTKCSTLMPVLLSANADQDLTSRENWRFSEQRAYVDLAADAGVIGVPFLRGRQFSPGWLEANVVHISDPSHPWHDPNGRTLHLWLRAANATPNLACVAEVKEDNAGDMRLGLPRMPSGKPVAYLPCPGGHLKFYILYDDVSCYYWLLSSQSSNSFEYPYERHRLALHFSTNCLDWQMAGMVAIGGSRNEARHYASMVIDGENLLILSRSGTIRAKSAHDGDMITLHRIERFRDLVY